MVLGAPATGMAIATSAARPSSALESGGSGGVNGSPNTTGDVEKHFERDGWTIEEIAAADIPAVANDRKDVAFCITDTHDPLDGTIRASDPIAVFTRGGETIELGSHFDAGAKLMQLEDRADGSEMRNIGVDATQDGRGAKWVINKGCTLRDVSVQGEQDGEGKWAAGVYIGGLAGDEEVRLRNLDLSDGATRNPSVPSHHDSIGVIFGGSCDGVLRMDGCTIGGFPNNGVYASGPTKQGNDGFAVIKNHTGFNSDRDQLRVGGESIIDGADLYIDRKKPGFDNLRGVWSRYARGVTIRDMSFRSHTSDSGEGVRIDSSAGRTTIEDSDIEMRSSHKAARGVCAYAPGPNAGDDHRVVIKDTRIHGDGSPRDAVLVKSRPTTFENLDIDMPDEVEPIDVR